MQKAVKATVQFSPVPHKITRDKNLSSNAKSLFTVLLGFDPCFPSYTRISSILGWGRTRIAKALKELIDVGLVCRIKRGRGRSNVYIVARHVKKPKPELKIKNGSGSGFQAQVVPPWDCNNNKFKTGETSNKLVQSNTRARPGGESPPADLTGDKPSGDAISTVQDKAVPRSEAPLRIVEDQVMEDKKKAIRDLFAKKRKEYCNGPQDVPGIVDALVKYELEDIEEAMNRCKKVKPFFPSLGEIMQAIPRRNIDDTPRLEAERKKRIAQHQEFERNEKKWTKVYGEARITEYVIQFNRRAAGEVNAFTDQLWPVAKPIALQRLEQCEGDFHAALEMAGKQDERTDEREPRSEPFDGEAIHHRGNQGHEAGGNAQAQDRDMVSVERPIQVENGPRGNLLHGRLWNDKEANSGGDRLWHQQSLLHPEQRPGPSQSPRTPISDFWAESAEEIRRARGGRDHHDRRHHENGREQAGHEVEGGGNDPRPVNGQTQAAD